MCRACWLLFLDSYAEISRYIEGKRCFFLSAGSGDLLGFGETALGRTGQVGIDTAFQFGGSEQSIGLDHILFAMHPLGLDGIEPGTLGGQQASENADAFATLLDLLVVRMKPGADQLTAMPGGVVPDEHENPLARLPAWARCWQHQSKNCVVTALTGRSCTKRSHICCAAGAAGR